MVNDREEADILRCISQLCGDVVYPILEVSQRDLDASVKCGVELKLGRRGFPRHSFFHRVNTASTMGRPLTLGICLSTYFVAMATSDRVLLGALR